jgi:hypothetical protein
VTARRAVVVPHPPLLLPELTGSGASAAEPLRAACAAAVRDLLDPAPAVVLLVGGGRATRVHLPGSWGTTGGLGVTVTAPVANAARSVGPVPSLPLSLTVGCRLLDLAGHRGRLVLQEVDIQTGPQACARLGRELAATHPDAPWLVLGDGTVKRGERAPGAFDPRSEPFDDAVEVALRSGLPARLLSLDPVLAADLGAAGRAAWQVLAGGWDDAAAGQPPVPARVSYVGAPFGVGYIVARWG